MTDNRTLENRFLGTVQAMVGIACTSRQFTKALIDLPESAEASEALAEALLGGVPKERLRSIAKACQGDSRRGREMAARLSTWIDAPREAAKALTEPAAVKAPAPVVEAPDTRTAIKALRERLDGEAREGSRPTVGAPEKPGSEATREAAKAHHDPSIRTVNGQIVNVKSYETAERESKRAHSLANHLAAHPEHIKAKAAAQFTEEAAQATSETAHPEGYGFTKNDKDHHAWTAEKHDIAYTAHRNIGNDLASSSFTESRDAAHKHLAVADIHKALYDFHQGKAEGNGVSDTTPELNHDDNMGTAPKVTINPKTDMVD